jgi:mannose-6-phosphate isomerase
MSSPSLLTLENPIKDYAWGDKKRLGELFGLDNPANKPQAEIWMGAHTAGPSIANVEGQQVPLTELIAREPEAWLGKQVSQQFDGRLPYLFKVLNAGQPLSIQLHPNKQQAEDGFAREQEEGIPLDAPTRNYRDPNHKPELICALTPFRALCGFRPIEDICASLGQLDIPALQQAMAPFIENPDGDALRNFCLWLLQLPGEDVEPMALEAARQSKNIEGEEFDELCELNKFYPGDRGIFFALMLNLVELEPGEALFLDAGHMHSYLGGVGLEIMASSDNVIRGGLTPKHIDCTELEKLATFEPLSPGKLRVSPEVVDAQSIYPTPVDDFTLALLDVSESATRYSTTSAEILLCIEGNSVVEQGGESITLSPGQSCFVGAQAEAFEVSGSGRLARATVSMA